MTTKSYSKLQTHAHTIDNVNVDDELTFPIRQYLITQDKNIGYARKKFCEKLSPSRRNAAHSGSTNCSTEE